MKKLLFIAVLFAASINLNAQAYKHALGLRFNHGYGGITYKKFISATRAWDFTLNANFDAGFGLTGLYEIHTPTNLAPNLFWYYGLGGHVSLWSGDYYPGNNDIGSYSQIGFGVDGVIGVEYVISEIPFAISLDYIPSFSIISTSEPKGYPDNLEWDGFDSGTNFTNWTVGIKYNFLKSGADKKKEEEKKKEEAPK